MSFATATWDCADKTPPSPTTLWPGKTLTSPELFDFVSTVICYPCVYTLSLQCAEKLGTFGWLVHHLIDSQSIPMLASTCPYRPNMRKPVASERKDNIKRDKLVLCKCNSYCAKHNMVGQYVSRSTRDNHSQADKLRVAREEAKSRGHCSTEGEASGLGLGKDMMKIKEIEAEVKWYSEIPRTSPTSSLVFENHPPSSEEYVSSTEDALLIPNRGLYSLRENSLANTAFLTTEYRLCELASKIQTMLRSDETSAVFHQICAELNRLDYTKRLQWDQQRACLFPHKIVVNTESHYYKHGPRNRILKAGSLVALAMQNVFFVTRRAIRANLAGMRDLLRASKVSKDIVDSIPLDPAACVSQFHLDPVTRAYLCCTRCACLHPYNPDDRPSSEDQPPRCSFQSTPQSRVCNEPLWKQREIGENRMVYVPIRRYLHQSLKFWVGRLLARPGMEEHLDKSPQAPSTDPDAPIDDIWLSQVLLHLQGSTGSSFIPSQNGEGRLIFGLAVDGFNPFHNKQAKQKVSSTGIWLVLLNLPVHLRHLPENICLVGVLPGPKKPSLDELNHSLELVVKDLLEFWDPGIFFTRTYNHPRGRRYRGMLVPLIGDMPAVRQVIGLPGTATAHYFCTFCDLDIDDIDILERNEWPAKSASDVRHFARLWKDAQNELDRRKIFEAFGLRWTVLLDLPYWDPILYTTIDSMHALDLGLFRHHIRDLFGIDLDVVGGDGSRPSRPITDAKQPKQITDEELSKCRDIIKENPSNLLSELLSFHRRVLYLICVELDIRGEHNSLVVGTRWVLVKNIFHWRQGQTDASVESSFAELEQTPISAPIPPNPHNTDTEPDASTPPLPPKDGVDLKLALRIILHISNIVESDPVYTQKAYIQGSAVVYRYLCDLLSVDHSGIPATRSAKRPVFDLLISSLQPDGKLVILTKYLPHPSPGDGPVLGADVMKEIWEDMENTQLPSWITNAPRNWGTSERGKLSADHYRTIGLIHLVITLIRLWEGETGRKKELLENFMHLVIAVTVANMRVSSRNQIESYIYYIFRYAEGLKALFPTHAFRPGLHTALHIGDVMELFGPVHGRSAPFYERFINFLHRVNTNGKLGELECTFMEACARHANLRAMLADDSDVRSAVLEMVTVMDSIANEDIRGFRLASMLDPLSPTYTIDTELRPFQLEALPYQLLCDLILRSTPDGATIFPSQALAAQEISLRGVCYATSRSRNFRSSRIMFQPSDVLPMLPNGNSSHLPGVIRDIFQYTYRHGGVEVKSYYISVQEYILMDTSNGRRDPYRKFGFAGGFLCEADPGQIHILELSQVISHVSYTKMRGQYTGLIYMKPLDRLMLSFGIEEEDQWSSDTPSEES